MTLISFHSAASVKPDRERTFAAASMRVRSGPILLKNSPPRSNGPDQQNFFPRKSCFASNICQMTCCENSVLIFRGDFRVSEFFNGIGPVATFQARGAMRKIARALGEFFCAQNSRNSLLCNPRHEKICAPLQVCRIAHNLTFDPKVCAIRPMVCAVTV